MENTTEKEMVALEKRTHKRHDISLVGKSRWVVTCEGDALCEGNVLYESDRLGECVATVDGVMDDMVEVQS